MDTSKVEWSYTYNRKKLQSENGNDQHWNVVRKQQMVPKDWWVEDLCELQLDLYKQEHSGISKSERKRICSLPRSIRAMLPCGFHGSSRSTTTNTEEEWDALGTAEDIQALKGELATLKLTSGSTQGSDKNSNHGGKGNTEKVAATSKTKGFLMSKKLFSKIWSRKERNGEITSSDTSESPASIAVEETKYTPSRSRRQLVS